ncbi:MAG: hypothetical protein IKT41_01180 [Clostridia bacterium]|nr:hypothetical protein [Clostridia bacterium]
MCKTTNPTNWEIKKHCTGKENGDCGCGAIVVVNEKNIQVAYGIESYIKRTYFFKCPTCNVCTDILPSEIPIEIRTKLKG